MFLGIDVGTSAVKAVLMTPDGTITDDATVPLTCQSPHPGWSEQDPYAWWQAVIDACAALPDLAAVAGVGLSGQMHGAVCLDADHTPIRPAILWNDGRAQAQCAAILAQMPDIGQRAGVNPMPGFTAPKLAWLAEHEPQTYRRIRHVLLPKDYIRLKLTGTLATDMTDAAGTLWLDQAQRAWSGALCAVSRTDEAWLPICAEGTAVAGTISASGAGALGLRAGVPVAAGGGDAAAGAVGIGAVETGAAFLSLGTSGQLFVVTDAYRPAPEVALHAYAHCVPERWFQMAAMLNGASPLQWWAGTVGQPIPALLTEAKAYGTARVPLFLPYLTGERTPHNDPHIRGTFYGLDNSTSQAAMTQAVLDAIAYSFCDARDALTAAGTVLEAPAVIGGGARGDHLLQTIADALGVGLRRYGDAQTGPAFGAARLAMVASGAGTLADITPPTQIDRHFIPNSTETTRHAERLTRYRDLYKALKDFAGAF